MPFFSMHHSVSFTNFARLPKTNDESNFRVCSLEAMRIEPAKPFSFLTPNCYPIATKSRKYRAEDRDFIASETVRLLNEKIIEHSKSPWRSQVIVTRNPSSGKRRMVVDYSMTINKFTLLDAYPLPNIEELVNKVAEYRYFSSIDLSSAYHQIPLSIEDRPKTAFEANGKLYQFTRLSFGLTNGVSCFQRVIDGIIEKENLMSTFPYIDDITICGHTLDEHNQNLNTFLRIAKKWGMTINYSKSKFAQTTIKLLGYEISQGVIKPDPDRLQPLLDYTMPVTKKGLQRLMGMLAYYAKWIPKYSQKIRPLIDATVPLSLETQNVLKNIIRDLSSAVRGRIDENKSFCIETDASDRTIAATLSQEGRPVAFFSRTLNGAEVKHCSLEKEAYAIVESIRKWSYLLLGRPFTIITDQRSVAFMFSDHANKIKNEKVARWRLELMPYKFKIQYRPGTSNVVADAFSRQNCNAVETNEFPSTVEPDNAIKDLLELHDTACHPGITRFWHLVKARNLPHSLDTVKKIVNSCPTCLALKPHFMKPPPTQLVSATRPFDRLNMDIKGPLPITREGYKYMLVVVDEYSRFPFAYPLKEISAATVIRKLKEIFSFFGLPGYIHSDRGRNFMSYSLRKFLFRLGIATSRSTPYHPTGNSQSERYVGIVWRSIKLRLHSSNRNTSAWADVLPDVLFALRSLLCTATNCTPHERLFNFPRRFVPGLAVPTWLLDTKNAYLRRFVRNKDDPLVDPVEILHANPSYSFVQFPDGRIDSVSNADLSPAPPTFPSEHETLSFPINAPSSPPTNPVSSGAPLTPVHPPPGFSPLPSVFPPMSSESPESLPASPPLGLTSHDSPAATPSTPLLRRSTRVSKPPERLNYSDFS